MDIGTSLVRNAIFVFCGLAGIYAVATLLRLLWLQYRRPPVVRDEPSRMEPPVIGELPQDTQDSATEPEPLPAVYAYPLPESVAGDEPAVTEPGFGVHLLRSRLEQEVRQLRDEVVTLRTEVGELKTARSVSPQYADAMALAQRGVTAQDLADRCGISLGEAELVSALARGPGIFEDEDNYGREERSASVRSA